ncbi:helix-turn-helix domain-containing protein [Cedecea sp. NFIX57]|uniref:helix-turn-helix domain-containing protein n=1 Tax=Cedecea sp. NFIX57 TaxID=1566286 RepID=UPI000A0E17AD|nr:helix-turn-helix transcriptional regulator [Cedecea sp. NFIX57]SMG61965.1 hypothetical protein SAMN03159353_10853 [Cedecea sp. NFIX57]
MPTLHPVVEILKNEIAKKNYTWEEAASGSGISPGRFEKIMRGERDMKVVEEERLCKFLGISVYFVERLAELERERQRAALSGKTIH